MTLGSAVGACRSADGQLWPQWRGPDTRPKAVGMTEDRVAACPIKDLCKGVQSNGWRLPTQRLERTWDKWRSGAWMTVMGRKHVKYAWRREMGHPLFFMGFGGIHIDRDIKGTEMRQERVSCIEGCVSDTRKAPRNVVSGKDPHPGSVLAQQAQQHGKNERAICYSAAAALIHVLSACSCTGIRPP
ncbi:hypothetical protein EDB86DRAFT_2825656 [Lactarius hatsudake]|nr:hypothetical protein EDB86DRAFT_2825656 [Lactarius hatsudake]